MYPARRPLVVGLFAGVAVLALVHLGFVRHEELAASVKPAWLVNKWDGWRSWDGWGASDGFSDGTARMEVMDDRVMHRLDKLRGVCSGEDVWEKQYGRTNLRMSRGYEGSHERMRQFILKALRGGPITVSTIGGSVTAGHGVWDSEAWFFLLSRWLEDYFPGTPVTGVNGAAPATGSDYFSFCFPLHIPIESDLIFVELGVNDEGLLEHSENMENLLRALLDLPRQPAVVLVEAMAFSAGGMGGGGGRFHLPVAQYYDVPVINQRHPLATHFANFPQLVPPYFAQNFWGYPDTRHLNSRGHRDLANILASFIQDVTCTMLAEPGFHVPLPSAPRTLLAEMTDETFREQVAALDEDVEGFLADHERGWPEQARHWTQPKSRPDDAPDDWLEEHELMPGMWMRPPELGAIPRMRVLDGWNPDVHHRVPPFRPVCLSARAKEAAFNLTPVAADGWDYWVHPEHLDKPYLVAKEPGATATFQLDTSAGTIKIYALKSREFGLGQVECWVDNEKDRSVVVDGYWEQEANIGRFATVREDLAAGTHEVSCRLRSETSDPGGGTEFRLISVMR